MDRPKVHYSMVIKNDESGARLKVELVDLPFQESRRFRVRVNGGRVRKLPVPSKINSAAPGARLPAQSLKKAWRRLIALWGVSS